MNIFVIMIIIMIVIVITITSKILILIIFMIVIMMGSLDNKRSPKNKEINEKNLISCWSWWLGIRECLDCEW